MNTPMNSNEVTPSRIDNGCVSFQPNFRQRLSMRLFPQGYVETDPAPFQAKDGIYGAVHCHFSLIDRIKLLLTGHAKVTFKIDTENVVGEHQIATGVAVQPPRLLAFE